MTAAKSIGALRATMGADSSEYDSTLSKVQAETLDFGRQMKKAFSQMAVAADLNTKALKTFGDQSGNITQKLGSISSAANQNSSSFQKMGLQTGNIAAQFQDIGVQLAGGQSPFLIALQQGTQLSAALSTVEGGIKGVGSALLAAFGSLVSPVSLLTIGVIALGGTIFEYFAGVSSGSKATEADLEKQSALVKSVADQWKEALPALNAYLDALKAAKDSSDLQQATATAVSNQWADARKFIDDATFSLVNVKDILSNLGQTEAVSTLTRDFNELSAKVENSTATADDAKKVQTELADIFEQTGVPAVSSMASAVASLAALLETATKNTSALKAESAALQRTLSFEQGVKSSTLPRLDPLGFIDPARDQENRAAATKSQFQTEVTKKPKTGGGGGKTEAQSYAEVVQKAQERIDLLKVEQTSLGQTEEASLKLRHEQELINQVQGVGKTVTNDQKKALGDLAQQMASVEVATKKAKDSLNFAKDATRGFLQDLRSGLANGKSVFESFGDAVANVLDKILSKMEDAFINNLFSGGGISGLGGATGSTGGGIFDGIGSILKGLFGFASGGSFQVGGVGGIDSQLVAFKASPNETVSVTKPGQSIGGSSGVVVNIINNNGSQVQQSQRQTAGGLELTVMIDEAVQKNLATPGSGTRNALEGQYGVKSGLARR